MAYQTAPTCFFQKPTADAVGLVQLTPLPSLAAFAACFSCSFRRLQLSPPPSSEFF